MSGCSCLRCKSMCQQPCWPTPKEARKLMKAGFGGRLMLDMRELGSFKSPTMVFLLSPAHKGAEGKAILHADRAKNCTFQLPKTHRCELHALGLKPLEGVQAMHGDRHEVSLDRRMAIVKKWHTKEGVAVLKTWHKKFKVLH